MKTIFTEDGQIIHANHINGYLMDGPDVWIESRTKPLCGVPEIGIGNKPIDGGNYLFLGDEMKEFIGKEPASAKYFRPWYGAEEFINGKKRYCLWLGDCTPHELRSMPECMKRVQAVREFRLASKSAGTRKIADKPTRFHVENMPNGNYLLVPSVSSERRHYVPMGFMSSNDIASNLVLVVPSATLYHFGVLTSSVHMAWMRVVAGRLETRYRYSAAIVYNNFPWPEAGNVANAKVLPITNSNTQSEDGTQLENGNIGTGNISTMATLTSPTSASLRLCVKNKTCSELQTPNSKLQTEISRTAQSILDARAAYPDSSLADLYDPLTMPPELRKAHAANDRAVLSAYGLAADTPEHEIVARLFEMYKEKSAL